MSETRSTKIDELALWKHIAADRSERMIELNLDRAAMGVTIMQLSEQRDELLADGALVTDMLDMFLRCQAEDREISDEEGRRATAALMRLNATIAKVRGQA